MRRVTKTHNARYWQRVSALLVAVALALSIGLAACGGNDSATFGGQESGAFKPRGVQGTGF